MQHVLSCLITLIFLACLWWKDLLNFKNLSICQLLLCLPLLHQDCIPISSLAPIIHITQNRSCLQDRPTKMFIHCSFSHFCLEPTLYNTTSLWCYGHHIITVLKDVRYWQEPVLFVDKRAGKAEAMVTDLFGIQQRLNLVPAQVCAQ